MGRRRHVSEVVRAAGGVVWRRGPAGVEILLVHRPKYDDWSLPKGKLDSDETAEAAALREVEEETGLRCSMGEELPPVTYTDRHGRAKVVRYWAMQPLGGRFRPNDEVDEVRWVTPAGAGALLSYGRDRQVTRSLAV